jgi:hypothetical protein
MAKLHGKPMLYKQAIHHHLIMSQPVVVCSHSFSKVLKTVLINYWSQSKQKRRQQQ